MARILRLAHLIVTPVLVFDDGSELTPGPEVVPQVVPLSGLAALASTLPIDLAGLQAQIDAEAAPKPEV